MSSTILPTRPGAILGHTRRGRPIRVIAGGDGTANPYLTRKRDQAAKIKESIDGLQRKATEEGRDLGEEELRSIDEQSKQYKTLCDEIESLTDVELRSQRVNELATQVAGGSDGGAGAGEGGQRNTSNAEAKDRDPGHYRSLTDGGNRSFFGDLYRSKMGDQEAERYLTEHNRHMLEQQKDRAVTTGSNTGVIPPIWLGDLWEESLRQGRVVANAVRRIPVMSPAPMTLPRQNSTAATAEVSESESVTEESPGFGSTTTTITPVATSGKQTVSRHLLDASNPTVDGLVLDDLVGDYNDKVEAKVVAAILAAGPTALVADADAAVTDNLHIVKLAIRAQVAVRRNRKRARANAYVMSVSRWGNLIEQSDTTGRPLIPEQTVGQAVNVAGVGSVASDGILRGLPILATDAAEPESISPPLEDTFATLHLQDLLLFESGIQRFSFEEPKGPEKVILAVWAYSTTHTRYGGDGVQTVDVEESPS